MSTSKLDPQKTLDEIASLLEEAESSSKQIQDKKSLEEFTIKFLGRKSKLTSILKQVKDYDEEHRKLIGSQSNQARKKIEEIADEKSIEVKRKEFTNYSEKDFVDPTLPSGDLPSGHIHPVTQMQWLTEDIFQRMGFDIVYPYEVDDDYHNFTSVNLPEGHPARDSWDTFWTEDEQIAITHTSSMQNRVLKSFELPIKVIVPGKCFRNEATDPRHEHTFTQVEGIYVDKGISLNHMLGTLKVFFVEFFEKDIEVKFTPDFFPFVEPGGMMSLTCVLCDGKGCKVCKQTGWLEILGCGMIHPKVLEMGGIDPLVYSGFAWGFGLERLVMLKYNIEDVRYFNSGKLDFIRQF